MMDMTAMYKLSYGLYVLSARENDKDNGCIINTAAQVTAEPNRISITVSKQNLTHDMVLRTGVFNVSVLSEEAGFDTYRHFGFASGRDTDKFADYPAVRAENGVLYVTEGVNALVSARVEQTVDLGSHTMFIAAVTEAIKLSEAPSATYAYYQAHVKPRPQPPKAKTVWRCEVCGYEYEGEELPDDFICPWCKHPASDFTKVE